MLGLAGLREPLLMHETRGMERPFEQSVLSLQL
jgi:hypothetical protein